MLRKPPPTRGLRLGTPALTPRGLKEDHMRTIAGLIDRVLKAEGEAKAVEAVRGEVLGMCRSSPL